MEIDDSFYMNLALDYAWENQALALSNPSVAALILDKNQKIIALCSHKQYGDSHAELLACKEAYKALSKDTRIDSYTSPADIYNFLISNHNGIFKNTSIYVTLEPCNHYGKTPPCTSLLKELKIKRVIISASEHNNIASGGAKILRQSGIEVTDKVLEQRGLDLLFPFLCMQQKGYFWLYKIATRLNGSFKNGRISSEHSLLYSHKLRNIADNIIISTKTLIEDNPLLDSRLINGKNPNVYVLGKREIKNKNLRIFEAKDRDINFVKNILDLPKNGFSIIEGGASMFESFKEKCDCLLIFISPNMLEGENFFSKFRGRILHNRQIGEDIMLWIKKD